MEAPKVEDNSETGKSTDITKLENRTQGGSTCRQWNEIQLHIKLNIGKKTAHPVEQS